MGNTPLKLHHGKAFGKVLWYQIQSYCGDYTPKFYTKKMGLRNLTLGNSGDFNPLSTDERFVPWRPFEWIEPLIEEISASDLPEDFESFKQKLGRITVQPSGQAVFKPNSNELGQASGFIQVNGIIRHSDPVITLGMGIPMLMKIQDNRAISPTDAIDLTQTMVALGITETITNEYYARVRIQKPHYPARFAWEAYHTLEAIYHTDNR